MNGETNNRIHTSIVVVAAVAASIATAFGVADTLALGDTNLSILHLLLGGGLLTLAWFVVISCIRKDNSQKEVSNERRN